MDLTYSDDQKAFRDELRAFLDAKLPKRLSDKVRLGKRLTKEDHEEWHALLQENNWHAGHWPDGTEYRAFEL
mgnify:CR=1 FL=1